MTETKAKTKSDDKPDEPAVDVPADVAPFDMAAKHTPDEWMHVLRHFTLGPKCGKRTRRKLPSWQHSCASAVCGWEQHKHDAGEPLKLSRKDYEGALKAAEAPPYRPPSGARSKYSKITFEE